MDSSDSFDRAILIAKIKHPNADYMTLIYIATDIVRASSYLKLEAPIKKLIPKNQKKVVEDKPFILIGC